MTVPFPLDAFDHAAPVRKARPPLNREKLVSAAVTVIFHAALVSGLVAMVHSTTVKPPREIEVQIRTDQPRPQEDLAPAPQMVKPTEITVAMPVIPPVISAAPIVAQPAPPVARPAPSTAPVAATQHAVSGEGRESFQARLLAQLNRYKQYPAAARKAHITGVVQLHFVMDVEGKVLSFEIAKSSGRPLLDAEALALIQRAQPLPALPADFPSRTLDAIVPIEFSLND